MVKRVLDNVICLLNRAGGGLVLAITVTLLANPAFASDLFLPNDFIGTENKHTPVDKKLSNEELVERAAALRNQNLSITQRALNHQWMSQYQHGGNTVGSKAFSRLFKRGFKKFWDEKRKTDFAGKNYIPDSNGKGKMNVGGEMDYNVRVSSSKIKLGVTYEF